MKKGFFFLRECDNRAVQECAVCQRRFCNEHLKDMADGRTVCLDCLGRENRQLESNSGSRYSRGWIYYDEWFYGYRGDFYGSEHYCPFYDGTDFDDEYYSDLDVRCFDDEEEGGDESDFSDSEDGDDSAFDS
jgi:hypothetical protein